MKVRVDICWAHKWHARLTLPDGVRLIVPLPLEVWNRDAASRAKDLILVERPSTKRGSIRFVLA